MKRLLFLSLSSFILVAQLQARVESVQEYAQQRAAMNKHAQSFAPPVQQHASPVRSAPLSLQQAPLQPPAMLGYEQLPSSINTLSDRHRGLLQGFVEQVAKKHGGQAAMAVMQSLVATPDRMRSTITLLETRPKTMRKVITDVEALKNLMDNPSRLIYDATSRRGPITQSLLNRVMGLKKMFSVREWGSMMQQFVGNVFRRLWHQIWRVVGASLTTVIGKENIYQLNPDGSFKVNKSGKRLPRMKEEQSIDAMGQPQVRMVPNKWFSIVEDERSLLGQIAQSGMDKATSSALKSMDRMIFRPVVSKMLSMPSWKLSHTQYLLAMHERKYPNKSIIDPAYLAERIVMTRNPQLLFTSGLPFPLRRILQMKNRREKQLALQKAITGHIWQEYEAIWKETAYREPGSESKEDNTKIKKDAPDTIKAHDSLLSEAGKELAGVGKDMLRGKLQSGPLVPYVIYTNLAMSIPRALFSSFGTGKPPETEILKKLLNSEMLHKEGQSDAATLEKGLQCIDLLEAVTRKIRSQQEADLERNQTTPERILIEVRGHDGTQQIYLAPATQKRLLLAQEKLIQKYQPFLGSTLTGESYQVYIKRLLLPRLIMRIAPESVRRTLGIKNLADAAKKAKDFEKHFEQSFRVLVTLNDLLSMIKRFEGMETFAGNYVEIADTLDRFLYSLSMLGKSFKVAEDDWGKRAKSIMRKTYGNRIGKRFYNSRDSWPFSWLYMGGEKTFTATQRQQIRRAQQRAQLSDQNVILLESKDTILRYIEGMIDETHLRHTFGTDGKMTKEDVERANKIQQGRANSLILAEHGINRRMTVFDLKQHLNSERVRALYSKKPAELKKMAERATKLLVQTFSLLTVHKDTQEDVFFTDGTGVSVLPNIDKNMTKLNNEINHKVWLMLSHLRAGISAASSLYNDYGLREVLAAFDEHYEATGEKMTSLPLKLIGKIVLREGMAHAVGLGADKLLNKALSPLMSQITRLQGNVLLGGPAVQNMLLGKVNSFIGNKQGRGNAYHATRDLVRNIFTYGSTALNTENIMATSLTKFMPSMAGAMGEQSDVMIHAKMAAESGRDPLPSMRKKMKEMGIDPQMMANMGMMAGNEPEGDMPMPGAQMAPPPMSPALQQLMAHASQLAQTQGEAAAMSFLQQERAKLAPEDQAILQKLLGMAGSGQ